MQHRKHRRPTHGDSRSRRRPQPDDPVATRTVEVGRPLRTLLARHLARATRAIPAHSSQPDQRLARYRHQRRRKQLAAKRSHVRYGIGNLRGVRARRIPTHGFPVGSHDEPLRTTSTVDRRRHRVVRSGAHRTWLLRQHHCDNRRVVRGADRLQRRVGGPDRSDQRPGSRLPTRRRIELGVGPAGDRRDHRYRAGVGVRARLPPVVRTLRGRTDRLCRTICAVPRRSPHPSSR